VVSKVAVDVGYGFTKAVSDTGVSVCFPSVVAPKVVDVANGVFKSRLPYQVRIKNVGADTDERLVGEAALRSMAAVSVLAAEKPVESHDLLLLTAAYLVGAGTDRYSAEQARIAVGLPFAYFKAQKEELKHRLAGLLAFVSVGDGADMGIEKRISFALPMVLPQGVGVIFEYQDLLPESGLACVVDVGMYTTDYLLIEVLNDLPALIPESCGSVEVGVHLVHRAVSAEFQARAGVSLPDEFQAQVVSESLAGKPVTYFGRELDLVSSARKARKETGQLVCQKVLAALGNRAGHVRRTLLAGGGSVLFRQELEAGLPVPHLVGDPVYANARGFLRAISGS